MWLVQILSPLTGCKEVHEKNSKLFRKELVKIRAQWSTLLCQLAGSTCRYSTYFQFHEIRSMWICNVSLSWVSKLECSIHWTLVNPVDRAFQFDTHNELTLLIWTHAISWNKEGYLHVLPVGRHIFEQTRGHTWVHPSHPLWLIPTWQILRRIHLSLPVICQKITWQQAYNLRSQGDKKF